MNKLLSASLLGTAVFLTGCETTVLQSPNHHGGNYGNNDYQSDGYNDYNGNDYNGNDGHHRSNHQTNVYETNVTENNVTRVNRTQPSSNSHHRSVQAASRPAPVHVQTTAKPHANPQHPASQQVQSHPNQEKANGKKKHGNGNSNNQN
jgi:hypothetical protein